jgi:hypothetical protein
MAVSFPENRVCNGEPSRARCRRTSGRVRAAALKAEDLRRPLLFERRRRSGDLRVNSSTADIHYGAVVTGDPSGDLVVAWTNFYQDGDSVGVFARRLVVPMLFDVDGDGSFSS